MKLLHFFAAVLSALACAAPATASSLEAAEHKEAPQMQPLARMIDGPYEARESVVTPNTTLSRLSDLSVRIPSDTLTLSGLRQKAVVEFPMRRDEIIIRAQLHLNWTPSPSLIPMRSQLNLRLNGEFERTLPIHAEDLGKRVTTDIELDPKKLKDFNQLEFEFIGSYADVCENPVHRTLWLTIDRSSSLSLTRQKLRVADELAQLPAPFIDFADHQRINLPIVLPDTPTSNEIEAAGMTASWAGMLSDWRGAEFPVYFDEEPAESHFIAFMTEQHRPSFLKDRPSPQGPEVAIADAPHSPWAKMLIVAGRDEAELKTAARMLVLNTKLFSGSRSRVERAFEPHPRAPYDAPKWVDITRKIRLGDLTTYPLQLSSRGIEPPAIHVDMRLPPDLFLLTRSTIPFSLKYRFTAPDEDAAAMMTLRINNQITESVPLSAEKSAQAHASVRRIPLVDAFSTLLQEINVPSIYFNNANTVQFNFDYALSIAGGSPNDCRTVTLLEHQADIDPDSSFDFSGFYHFARMPNLALYAKSGYPFSIHADLSRTLAVLPAAPEPAEVSLLMTALGRIAAQTGAVGSAVEVKTGPTPAELKNSSKDILFIGENPEQLLDASASASDNSPSVESTAAYLIEGVQRRLEVPLSVSASAKARRDPVDVKTNAAPALLAANGGAAAIVGFEAPFDGQRSVVALLTTPGDGTRVLLDKLASPQELSDVGGSASLIYGADTVTAYTGPLYYIGDLPWHQRLWYAMLEHPLLLVLGALLCALAVAVIVYAVMRVFVRRRLNGGAA